MKIIPVIDHMHGQVVLAEKGNRSSYQPIKSKLCEQTDIESVLNVFLSLANFNTIYIADLDSIENRQLDFSFWAHIFSIYPTIQFWCDFGTQVSCWKNTKSDASNARPIIGSESFISVQTLTDTLHAVKHVQPLLSLDFRDGNLLGPRDLLTKFSLWTDEIIILSLSRVGSLTGPDFELIQTLQMQLPDCKLYTGGGVRSVSDIRRLRSSGVSGTLLAKSLHTKSISARELAEFTD